MEEEILSLLKGKSVADIDKILNSVRKRVAMRSVYGSAKDIEAWEQQRLKKAQEFIDSYTATMLESRRERFNCLNNHSASHSRSISRRVYDFFLNILRRLP